jgi:lactoylglutathione lyase
VLGLKPTWGDEKGNFASFAAGDGAVTMGLFKRELMVQAIGGTEGTGQRDSAALVFKVDDVDAVLKHAAAQGAVVVSLGENRPDWGIRAGHLRDPDGQLLELFSPLPKSAWSDRLKSEDARFNK